MHPLPVAFLHDPDAIARSLEDTGACLLAGFPEVDQAARLRRTLQQLHDDGSLQQASVGHHAGKRPGAGIRGDGLHWLDGHSGPAAAAHLASLHALRTALNRRLFLGMDELEAHFAWYPPGAAYHRHRDQFSDSDARVLSLVSYLNEDWQPEHGGALRLHLAQGAVDVLPQAGTSLVFLSQLEHEVLPAIRDRLSIAAWLRKRA